MEAITELQMKLQVASKELNALQKAVQQQERKKQEIKDDKERLIQSIAESKTLSNAQLERKVSLEKALANLQKLSKKEEISLECVALQYNSFIESFTDRCANFESFCDMKIESIDQMYSSVVKDDGGLKDDEIQISKNKIAEAHEELRGIVASREKRK